MKRRALLACSLTLLASVPKLSGATSLDPIYAGVRTIVLHVRIESQERDDALLIPREEMQLRLVEFIRSELSKRSLQIAVTDRNSYVQPRDYPSDWVLWLECRFDLATRHLEGESPKTIGVVSVVFQRGEDGGRLAGEPFEIFFLEKDDSALVTTAETAAKASLNRDVIDPITRSNQ
ncbi:MAG TPA: hypothetical protein VJV39_00545 [Dongiaceae bacterium]|nr:hypothetical protein [Dongiaceae bacterium]